MPSISQLSVNPLTVSKAYQSFVELGIVEKKRARYVLSADARKKLLKYELEKFINEDWPLVARQIKALGLSLDDLFANQDRKKSNANR